MPITTVQRAKRQRYLGSSDLPVILGVSPYSRTQADIYWSKVAELSQEGPTKAMQTGNWLEGSLLDWAEQELVVKLRRNQFRVAQEGDGAGIFAANCDALVRNRDEGVEAKFANGEMAQRYGEPGTGEVPDDIVVQTQHQMYCAGLGLVWVPVAVPSRYGIDRRMYRVERDDELIRMIVSKGREWWVKHVVARVPPDGCETPPIEVLRAIDRTPGTSVDLDSGVLELVDEFERLKMENKETSDAIEGMKARIIEALGEAEVGHLPDGRMVTYSEYSRTNFDRKKLEIEHPELAGQYLTKSSYRTLYVKAPKQRAKSA